MHRAFPARFEPAIGMQKKKPIARSRAGADGKLAAAPARRSEDLGICQASTGDGFVR